jgi:hypothetical protein
MKCEACLNLLEEYGDGELAEREAAQVSAHLITCASCADQFESLAGEQEIYARYDRGLEVAPSLWPAVEAMIVPPVVIVDSSRRSPSWLAGLFAPRTLRLSFAGAMAVVIVAAVIGVAYLRLHQQPVRVAKVSNGPAITPLPFVGVQPVSTPIHAPTAPTHVAKKKNSKMDPEFEGKPDPSDVLNPDIAAADLEDQDTQRHIEQAQNLLRSVRNLQPTDGADEIDVSYEKALSRRLLNENVILRRDAEMSGKFPAKTLLSDLEPFLIDIANLPDKAGADDLRVIKERVKSTEIVAALQGY